MPGLDELRIVLSSSPGHEQAVDAVPGIAEDLPHIPFPQSGKQNISDRVRHRTASYARPRGSRSLLNGTQLALIVRLLLLDSFAQG